MDAQRNSFGEEKIFQKRTIKMKKTSLTQEPMFVEKQADILEKSGL